MRRIGWAAAGVLWAVNALNCYKFAMGMLESRCTCSYWCSSVHHVSWSAIVQATHSPAFSGKGQKIHLFDLPCPGHRVSHYALAFITWSFFAYFVRLRNERSRNMAKFIYEVRIHTEDYIPRKTTWKPENKVINQFMEGLGEWSANELSLQQVQWRLELFLGIRSEACGSTPYMRWVQRNRNNELIVIDEGRFLHLDISPYGQKKENFDVHGKLAALGKERERQDLFFRGIRPIRGLCRYVRVLHGDRKETYLCILPRPETHMQDQGKMAPLF